MISIIITICVAVLLLAGVGYAIYEYLPYVTNFVNNCTSMISGLSSFLPSWLIPFVGVSLAIALIGLLVKLL